MSESPRRMDWPRWPWELDGDVYEATVRGQTVEVQKCSYYGVYVAISSNSPFFYLSEAFQCAVHDHFRYIGIKPSDVAAEIDRIVEDAIWSKPTRKAFWRRMPQ